MRFLSDLQCCQSGSRLGGIGRYSLELTKAIISLTPDFEHIILLNDSNAQAEAHIRQEFRDLLQPNAFKICAIPPRSAYLSDLGETADLAAKLREIFIANLAPDVVHLASLVEGYGDDIATSVVKEAGYVQVVTLYDLIPLRQPQLYLTTASVKAHYTQKTRQFRYADALLAISQYTANEGREFIEGFDGVIANIRGGIDPRFKPLPDSESQIRALRGMAGIDGKFLLYTASFDQRKNQKGLIEAFGLLPESVRSERKLVIVGKGWPAAYDELRQFAAAKGLGEADLVFPGHVTDDELAALYGECELFVFPPLWEGLGLPVLEAMACGAPVIGSNTTSVPEVLGLEEASFDPFDAQDISRVMARALTEPAFMAQLKDHAARHSAAFTWEASAHLALAAIKEAIERKADRTTSPLETKSLSIEPSRDTALLLAQNEVEAGVVRPDADQYRIGWVSSWGTRCGIASHSANLLAEWDDNVVVLGQTLLHPGDEQWSTELPLDRCWTQGKDDTLSLLSDALDAHAITDVIIQFNYGFFNFAQLNWLMSTQVMKHRRVYITLHSTNDPLDEYGHRLGDIKDGLIQCTRIFVHNEIDVHRLRALGIGGNVSLIPLGLRSIEGEISPHGGDGQLISAYGFFLPNKGLPELVSALALMRERGENVRLRLVNADYGDQGGVSRALIEETRKLADRLGCRDHVEFITDFLSDEESVGLLREADLLVYAYQATGESASAAVRMGMASKVPLAVTPLSIFDDVKRAAFVLPGTSPSELADGISGALIAIREQTLHARDIAKTASNLRRVQNYGKIARSLQDIISRDVAREHWTKWFEADMPSLPVMNGQAVKRHVRAARQGGIVVYGPYIEAAAGLYRLVLTGGAQTSVTQQNGLVEIKSQTGQNTIASFPIHDAVDGVLIDRKFRIPAHVSDLEVVVSAAADSGLLLTGYGITRRFS